MNLNVTFWKLKMWFDTWDHARAYQCIDVGVGVVTSNLHQGDIMPNLSFRKLFRSRLQIEMRKYA